MKKIGKILSVFALGACVVITGLVEAACNCSSNYAGNYIVNTSRLPLTMRSGHGSNYSKIMSIPKGATVYVSASNGTWAHVSYGGRNGYVSMQYLRKVQQPSASSGLVRGAQSAATLATNEQVKNRIWWMKANLGGYIHGTKYTGSGQCRGFANKVYTYPDTADNMQTIS